jgi:hypothetical protein
MNVDQRAGDIFSDIVLYVIDLKGKNQPASTLINGYFVSFVMRRSRVRFLSPAPSDSSQSLAASAGLCCFWASCSQHVATPEKTKPQPWGRVLIGQKPAHVQ